jgi:dTDP-4-amino-4,6-dideoxygalactose transaminase
MVRKIPLGRPSIGSEEIEAVEKVLRSGWLVEGPNVKEFEKQIAEFIGTKYAVAVNSCTSALHLSLAAIGVGEGDEVIVPSFTYPATANAVICQGGAPVFVEVDEVYHNIDPEKIEEKVTKRTKAIIPVHYAGHSADMDPIVEVAEKHGLVVIEDAAEALGAEYKGERVGSIGVGCFSFWAIKNLTTGEGGMITTNDEEIDRITRMMRGHGVSKGTWFREREKKPWERIQVELGYNFRMTDFQGAMGLVQLGKLEEMNRKRISHAGYLDKQVNELAGITPPAVMKGCKHVYQMYTPTVEDEGTRDKVVESLRERGVGASVHFDPPTHLMPYYRKKYGYKEGVLPITEKTSKTILTLPMFPDLTREELDYILVTLEDILKEIG